MLQINNCTAKWKCQFQVAVAIAWLPRLFLIIFGNLSVPNKLVLLPVPNCARITTRIKIQEIDRSIVLRIRSLIPAMIWVTTQKRQNNSNMHTAHTPVGHPWSWSSALPQLIITRNKHICSLIQLHPIWKVYIQNSFLERTTLNQDD